MRWRAVASAGGEGSGSPADLGDAADRGIRYRLRRKLIQGHVANLTPAAVPAHDVARPAGEVLHEKAVFIETQMIDPEHIIVQSR